MICMCGVGWGGGRMISEPGDPSAPGWTSEAGRPAVRNVSHIPRLLHITGHRKQPGAVRGAVPSHRANTRETELTRNALRCTSSGREQEPLLSYSASGLVPWGALPLREIKTKKGPPECPSNFFAGGLFICKSVHLEYNRFFPGKTDLCNTKCTAER